MTKMKEHHIMCAEDLVQHQSLRKTAACFGVDESTLRYRLERKRQQPLDGRSLQPEACAPHEEVISRWMSGQENLPPGKRPEPVKALYETLVSKHGYEGSYKAVVRYVRRRTEQPPLRPFRRVETAPGAQAQVDWLETVVNVRDFGGPTRLSAFLLTLSYSRMWAVVWSRREDMLSWLHLDITVSESGVCQPTCRFSGLKVSRALSSFSGLSHTTFSSSRFLTGRVFHRSGYFRFASSNTCFLAARIALDSPR